MHREEHDCGGFCGTLQIVTGLKRFYRATKNVLSPQEAKLATPKGVLSEAPHPGTEGVSFEEALERCPHLAEQYKQHGFTSGQTGAPEAPSRCPYKNDASQEWPLRAVLIFISYNIISVGVSMEVVKMAFVICAYHIGMLRITEFVVLYLTTATMSSYKLLGLLLMLTIKGGPVLSLPQQYRFSLRQLLYGFLISLGTVLITGLSMSWASYMEYFKKETMCDSVLFSPLHHVLIPIGAEFVYRGYLCKEMGRDLGSWFGVIGSSGWFCVLQRGPGSVKFAAFVQGVFWSLCTTAFQGNLVPTTIAHVFVASLRTLYPSLYFVFYPEKV